MSKKLEEKQARRLAEERRRAEQQRAARRRNLVTVGIALLVAVLVIGAIVLQRQNEVDQTKVVEDIGSPADDGCGNVETFKEQSHDHIEVGAPHEPYSTTPPTSGDHYATPAEPGFYPTALPPEQLVHNLEHGMIVIWYDPDAPRATIEKIEQLVAQEPEATVATPYDQVEDPYEFVLTGWRGLQRCVEPSQETVDNFRRELQGKGREPITPPFEG
ncbi:MAG: DUF3105 domain-containing protein [Actinomycetota bacterium]